jgi:hypothetical protein
MLKNVIIIILIVSFFGVIKLNAPTISSALPDWAGGILILVVFCALLVQFVKFLIKSKGKNE